MQVLSGPLRHAQCPEHASVNVAESFAGATSEETRLRNAVASQPHEHLKVAVIHEWLVTWAGSEKVLEQILKVFPEADLFALIDFLRDDERALLGGRQAKTSFIQHLPRARTAYRNYLPLMPLAVEQFDLSAYDLVISSSHAVAKGIITGPDQTHISYVYTPIRYAWDLQHQYLREAKMETGLKSWAARACLHYLRMWDVRTAYGVDNFLACSAFVARRIRKVYGRDATVVYPPVDTTRFTLRTDKEDFYVAASRMVPYKRMPMIVEAFAAMPEKRLVMIGDGPELERVKFLSRKAPNILVMGYQPPEVLADLMGRARAFIFAAQEDFGISPVEAQACGTPVIAYGAGGVLETVVSDPDPKRRTGLFFHQQTAAALRDAVREFEALGEFKPEVCRLNAERFSRECFQQQLRQAVGVALTSARGQVAQNPSFPRAGR